MSTIHITDIEAAINHWRARSPSPDGVALAPPVLALAEVYARMVYARAQALDEADLPAPALAAWLDWYATTPDTPCIAICSTSQGDDCCKGCGRSLPKCSTGWPTARRKARRLAAHHPRGHGLALQPLRRAGRRKRGWQSLIF